MPDPDDVIPPFERCGNTAFWKPKAQTNDSLRVIFVDPVDILVVQTISEEDHLQFLVGWFDGPVEGLFMRIHEALPPKESVPLIVWLRTILEFTRKTRKKKKNQIVQRFAAMPPEAQQRIVEGILHWLAKDREGWQAFMRPVPADAAALWEALNDVGVHEC